MTNELFLAQFQQWIAEMRRIASERPGTGACTLATAMKLWLWTLNHLQNATDADGAKLYHKSRQGVTFPLADALCWLLAARQFILDVDRARRKGRRPIPRWPTACPGFVNFFTDLCHVQSARAAGEVGRICAELVYGYNRHPAWDEASCQRLLLRRGTRVARRHHPRHRRLRPRLRRRHRSQRSPSGQSRPVRASSTASKPFVRLRAKLDGCLTGARLAKDRAAEALTKVMIPEALDYPV